MASRVRIRLAGAALAEKLASLHWPFVALLLLIGCVGYLGVLYSAGGATTSSGLAPLRGSPSASS
ncbi:MAG: hypothetical protein R3C69_01250 [Geminicoccaceae bacterium]